MLVLKRKVGESIIIAEGIEVVVLGLEGSHVRLGVKAPRDIPVFRRDLSGDPGQQPGSAHDKRNVSNVFR
ncbi:MAG: carbon storage regulator [Candidatus Carbobacillus sp.]|nr:carbon storage regulator [Candidatus Carbobacillus sp.]